MPSNHKTRDVLKLETQMITTIIKLLKHNVPVCAVWYKDNEVKNCGSKNLKNVIQLIDRESMDTAVKGDVLNLASQESDEPLLENENLPENIRQKQFCQSVNTTDEPDLLPFPLPCMNKKEKTAWITKQILREQCKKTGEQFVNVRYGDPGLKPSFWLEDEWEWRLVNKNLSNVRNDFYTGPGNFQDFLNRLIENCLNLKNKDPIKHVAKSMDNNMLKKKMKNKGIHEDAHILQNESGDEVDDPENNLDDEREATASEYRLPVSPERFPGFIPRRKLPDDRHQGVPGIDPAPPAATQAEELEAPSPPRAGSPLHDLGDMHPYPSQIEQPILSDQDFYNSWEYRAFLDPPPFLMRIPSPLHEGWKSLENAGGGPCLFRTGADHIKLKDFRVLRRYVHAHISKQWYFYRPFYSVYPLCVTIGTGNGHRYTKTIPDERAFLDFLKSEESMMAWNTGAAEVVALGNVLNTDVFMLTYNTQGVQDTPEERTQWNTFNVNHGLTDVNGFCRNTQEPLPGCQTTMTLIRTVILLAVAFLLAVIAELQPAGRGNLIVFKL